MKGYLCHKPELDKARPHSRSLLNQVIKTEVRSKRRLMKEFPAFSQLHLAYLHLQLLADIQLEVYDTNNILERARTIATLITQGNPPVVCPLTHHWTALAAVSLMEHLVKSDNDNETIAVSRKLLDRLSSRQWDRAIAARLEKHRPGPEHDNDRGGLEHLANAAVGKSKTTDVEQMTGNEPLQLVVQTSQGYLSVFE